MQTAKRNRRDRDRAQQEQPPVVRWLQAGTVAVGMGAAMACGTGVAEASTGDDTEPATTTESEPTSSLSSNSLADSKSIADPVTPPAALSRHAGPVVTITRQIAEELRTALQSTTKSRVVGRTAISAQGVIKSAPTRGKPAVGGPKPAEAEPAEPEVAEKALAKASTTEKSEPAIQKRFFVPSIAELQDVSTATTDAKSRIRAFRPSAATGLGGSRVIASAPTTFVDTSRTTTAVPLALVIADPVNTPSYPAQLRAPVTLRSMVTDVFRWVGLGAPTTNTPVPAMPVPRIVELLWVGLRRVEYTVANDYPTTKPVQGAQAPAGGTITTAGALDVTVTGSLNAKDPDGDKLTYTVVTPPGKGTVVIDQYGTYTYKANPAFGHLGGEDSFTVRIDDTAGNPWHVHGLASLFGHGRPTTVTVPVTVAAVNRAPIAPSSITAPAPGADGKVIGSIGASDPDLDTLTYSIYKDPFVVDLKPKGQATINPTTGTYTYTPAAWARHEAAADGASPMSDTFYVTTTDSYGASVRTAVTVSIKAANQNPTATPEVVQDPAHQTDRVVTSFTPGAVWSQTTASTAVMLIKPNVVDEDFDVVTVTATNADPTLGTVAKNVDGTFTYTPSVYSITNAAAGAAETDTVTLVLNDGHGGVVSVDVSINIAPVIDARTTLGGDLTLEYEDVDTSGLANPDDQIVVTSVDGLIMRVGGDLVIVVDGRSYNLGQASNLQSVQVVKSGNKAYVYAQSFLAAILDLGTD
jgi:VCBS repeat-containing protein